MITFNENILGLLLYCLLFPCQIIIYTMPIKDFSTTLRKVSLLFLVYVNFLLLSIKGIFIDKKKVYQIA